MKLEDFLVYKKAFDLASDLTVVSKTFPEDEKDSLVFQLIRSSKAVYVILEEAYKKKKNEKLFINKLNDANNENTESRSWLRFAGSCRYISSDVYNDFLSKNLEVEKLIKSLIKNPKKI